MADLRLAVNRNYTHADAARSARKTCFLTVVVWGKQAESCGEYLDKGSQVFVEGRLQTRDWEGKDGQKRTATEVVAERVQFMSRTKGGGAGAPGDGAGARRPSPRTPAPAATTTSRSKRDRGGASHSHDAQKPIKRRRFGRRKVCKFCADKVDLVDYKDVRRLRSFVTERGKIIPRRISGSCARHQRQLTHAIKRARTVALLPYLATD